MFNLIRSAGLFLEGAWRAFCFCCHLLNSEPIPHRLWQPLLNTDDKINSSGFTNAGNISITSVISLHVCTVRLCLRLFCTQITVRICPENPIKRLWNNKTKQDQLLRLEHLTSYDYRADILRDILVNILLKKQYIIIYV